MKGVNLAVYLVLAVVLIGLGIVFYNKIRSWSCVSDPFGCTGKKSDLEAAAECVMARCTDGCESDKVKKIKTDKFDCQSQCDPKISALLGEAKVRYCGFQFPIVVNVDKKMKVDKKSISQDYLCFFKFSGSKEDIKKIVTIGPAVQTNHPILGVEEFHDEEYEIDHPGLSECSRHGTVLKSFEIKGKKTLYVYGDIEPFVIENDHIYEPYQQFFFITFITDEPLYPEEVSEKSELTIKYQAYYPLEKNYGLIIRETKSYDKSCVTEPGCPNPNDLKICMDILCGETIEKVAFCTSNRDFIEVCNGRYKIKPVSLPDINSLDIFKFSYKFEVERRETHS